MEPVESAECYIVEGWTLKEPEVTLETDMEDSLVLRREECEPRLLVFGEEMKLSTYNKKYSIEREGNFINFKYNRDIIGRTVGSYHTYHRPAYKNDPKEKIKDQASKL